MSKKICLGITMDPYLSGGYPMAPPASGGTSMKYGVSIVACILVLGVVAYFILRTQSPQSTPTPTSLPMRTNAPAPPAQPSAGGGGTEDDGPERNWVSDAPEAKLADFAFESYTLKNYVPDKTAKLARKPAGNPPYKLVGCESSGSYAIRWAGMYLAVLGPNSVKWVPEKQEPGTCFKLIPGHCGSGNNYVMMRSMANKLFLRADGPTNALMCKDTPTGRTAAKYCWKLQPDFSGKQPCGQQYSYDLGRIIDVPCNVTSMPAAGGSCSTVTAGYRAACCLKKGAGADHDTFCTSTIFPKVVGQNLQQALLYIRTRRPDLALKPCPTPCTLKATPIQNPNMVVVPYDARSNIVTSTPYRLE